VSKIAKIWRPWEVWDWEFVPCIAIRLGMIALRSRATKDNIELALMPVSSNIFCAPFGITSMNKAKQHLPPSPARALCFENVHSLAAAWTILETALFDEDTGPDERADIRLAFYVGASRCADLLQSDPATVLHELASFLAEQEPT
jgi:hypothetical protein